jgi:hypothetical protein
MKRFILLCLLATLFVACTSSTEPEQAADPTDSAPAVAESPTEPPAPLPTEVQEATDEPTVEEDTTEAPVADGAKTFLPALTPAEAGEIRDTDFVKGNPDAAVTIIEYGDFQ